MYRSPVLSRVCVILALATLAIALGAQGPPPQDPQPRQPPLRVQANYVRVDAYPTRDGRPVLDLGAADFQVFENGTPQTIAAFEHVLVGSGGPQAQRVDPSSIREAQQAAENPRSRVFIIFLDAYQVTIEGSWKIREPLIRLIDRILAPDDLVAIMTPEMAPSQITLARKTEVIERGLRNAWPWGVRHTLREDEKEALYKMCFPASAAELLSGQDTSELARKMIERRRERMTLEALHDLVRYLRDLREERKAILTVTEGWLLHGPDPSMTAPRTERDVPGPDPIGIGVGGKLRSRDTIEAVGKGGTMFDCNTDRMRLAQDDNDRYFRDIVDEANRSNASFYPIDPRGLAVFDSPIGPGRPPPIHVDQAYLRKRLDSMQTLAIATDGILVISSNDLDASLKRIADDLTSYYLLGYYSTNSKLDGTFRKITVRVNRPGVDVRARRGYRAPTEEEVRAARAAAAPEPPSPEESAIEAAVASLARIRPEARFRIHAVPSWDADGAVARVWVAGEVQPFPASDPWSRGGTANLEIVASGATATGRIALGAGERTFVTSVTLPAPARDGAIDVRARLGGADPAAAHLADSVHVPLTKGSRLALLFRRGPTTGNRYLPAATFLFSRTERVRMEFPVPADAKPGSARMLDRSKKPLAVPVTVGQRTDESGTRWMTADVTLAPLGAGDYVVEVSFGGGSEEHKTVTAIRVTR